MGPGSMGSGMMMRMLFTLMDSDGDGTVYWQEFRRLTRDSREWTLTKKMAASPWTRSRPSCREPGDRFRGSRVLSDVDERTPFRRVSLASAFIWKIRTPRYGLPEPEIPRPRPRGITMRFDCFSWTRNVPIDAAYADSLPFF